MKEQMNKAVADLHVAMIRSNNVRRHEEIHNILTASTAAKELGVHGPASNMDQAMSRLSLYVAANS